MPNEAAPSDTTGAPEASTPALQPRANGRPYGLLALAVSVPVILLLMTLLMLVAVGLAFAGVGLAVGWHETIGRLGELSPTTPGGKVGLEHLLIALSLVAYAALSVAILGAASWRGGTAWRDVIGWHAWHPFRASRLVWTIIPLTIVYGLAADALVAWLYPPSKDWIVLPKGPLWVSLFILLAVAFAPVTEELFFRGWLYTALRARIGVWASIMLTSVLFALAHWERTHIYALAVFPVGVALAYVRERTGSLAASMTCHAAYNGAASVLLLFGF